MKQRNRDLTEGNIKKQLATLTVPMLFGMIGMAVAILVTLLALPAPSVMAYVLIIAAILLPTLLGGATQYSIGMVGDGNQEIVDLAISIETRKEVGETYSAVLGFFRQFELYYVVSDESDVVALRTNQRGERVELYRTLAMPTGDRALLLDYVREMNALAEAPRWYNALTHNCTTTIWHHAKAVGSGFPLDWRLLANGYLLDLSYELGTVNTSIGLDELKRRSDITLRAREAGDGVGFSRAIRQGVPSRPSADTQEPAPG